MVSVCCYIDPSAVTYMIQAVAAVAIAGGAALTVLRKKIMTLLQGHAKRGTRARICLLEEAAPYDLYIEGSVDEERETCS